MGGVVEPTALLLGAGFSKWAAGLPLASNLFDFRLRIRHERERGRLRLITRLHRDFILQDPEGTAEQFIGQMIGAGSRSSKVVKWYVTRRLSDPFIDTVLGGTQALMIDDSRTQNLRGVRRAKGFLQLVSDVPISGIVTPNYDLLVEYSLGTTGFNYGERGEILFGRGKNRGFPWRGAWPILTGHLPLAKIHGSVSWDETTRYTDGRAGVNGNAMIIAPHVGKSMPVSLQPVWDVGKSVIRSASRMIVFGFAFNAYDKELLRLLETAGKELRSVLLIDIKPPIDAVRGIFPNAEVISCLPPPAGTSALVKWLGRYWVNKPTT